MSPDSFVTYVPDRSERRPIMVTLLHSQEGHRMLSHHQVARDRVVRSTPELGYPRSATMPAVEDQYRGLDACDAAISGLRCAREGASNLSSSVRQVTHMLS